MEVVILKTVFWIIGGLFACIGIAIGIVFWIFQKDLNKDNPDYVLQFLKENKDNEQVSLAIHYNQQNWVEMNTKKPLPLASTVKIIVAIEYAQQAAEGRINSQQLVSLEDLQTFYIPKTDGGAHEAWLKQLKQDNKIENNFVSLNEVANGMIAYSSNANTEFLMELLGLENINKVLEQLNLMDHEPLYPIVSSLYIPTQFMKEKGLTKKETLTAMKAMDMTEYRERALSIHEAWLKKPLSNEEKKKSLQTLDMDFQKVWSDRLIRATTADYITILEKLNHKNFFNEDVHKYLDPVMEQLMQNSKNQKWLLHGGQKGGSTAFVLTLAAYTEDKDGNQTEIAFFANNLNRIEQTKLSKNMNSFQLKFLTDEKFRLHVQKELSP